MSAFKIAFIACFLPFVFVLIDYIFQKSFIVHEKGIVLITGASTGIGRHAGEYLANHTGYTVLLGVRKIEDAEEIAAQNKPNLIPIILDVTSHESINDAVTEIKKKMEDKKLPFVALVNNAGISRRAPFELHDLDDIKFVFNTNLFGTIDLTQILFPLLRESKGRIVMVSSVSGKVGNLYFLFNFYFDGI